MNHYSIWYIAQSNHPFVFGFLKRTAFGVGVHQKNVRGARIGVGN